MLGHLASPNRACQSGAQLSDIKDGMELSQVVEVFSIPDGPGPTSSVKQEITSNRRWLLPHHPQRFGMSLLAVG